MKMIMAFGGNDLKIPIYFFSEENEKEIKNLVDYFNKIENFTEETLKKELEENSFSEIEIKKMKKYCLIETLQTNFLGNHFLVKNPYMAYIYKLEIQDIPVNQKFLEIDLD